MGTVPIWQFILIEDKMIHRLVPFVTGVYSINDSTP
jgi:hypothetical protein